MLPSRAKPFRCTTPQPVDSDSPQLDVGSRQLQMGWVGQHWAVSGAVRAVRCSAVQCSAVQCSAVSTKWERSKYARRYLSVRQEKAKRLPCLLLSCSMCMHACTHSCMFWPGQESPVWYLRRQTCALTVDAWRLTLTLLHELTTLQSCSYLSAQTLFWSFYRHNTRVYNKWAG
jgi:hypothetical protein